MEICASGETGVGLAFYRSDFLYAVLPMLAVYDATGQLYHGRYVSSLLTEQEYDKDREMITGEVGRSCEPRTNFSIDVTWP